MTRIVRREQFSPQTFLWEIDAPDVARAAEAGHFVMLRLDDAGERIPPARRRADRLHRRRQRRRPGFVTGALQALREREKPDLVIAIGPMPMMQACTETTRPFGVPTKVSLNTIMVDGTGMCGSCRVTVGGEVKFACVDGPDFDAHRIDFAELLARQKRFKTQEQQANADLDHVCSLEELLIRHGKQAEAPARVEELRRAQEEGVQFSFLHGPVEVLLNDAGDVRALRAQRMALGEPGARGRSAPGCSAIAPRGRQRTRPSRPSCRLHRTPRRSRRSCRRDGED